MNFDKIEAVFFNVLNDLKDYMDDLTIVGGWMPYIYSNFLWKNFIRNPVTTVDIDIGVDQDVNRSYSRTIFETLSSLGYSERHPRMDRMFPVILLKDKIPVEFITYPDVDTNVIEKFVGRQMHINKIIKFDFLLRYRMPVKISNKNKSEIFVVYCPKPSAFLYHKGATFISRENKEKQAKDLYYMYYILRYAPDLDVILQEVLEYKKAKYFEDIQENLDQYFERISSSGCLMVEKENGPDEFIADLRQDIYERFGELRKNLCV